MDTYPQLGPQYYDEPHRNILSRMESDYANGITINQSFWSEADTDTRFRMGDQTIWNDLYGNLPVMRKRQFNFNKINRIVNLVSGQQRDTRKSTIAIPGENGNQLTADQWTKMFMWIAQREGELEIFSDAFENMLVTGMTLLHYYLDYSNDPLSGDIKVEQKHYNSFMIDPYFQKDDLSDCNYLWVRSYLTKRQCIASLPQMKEEIMGLVGQDARDGKFQFMAQTYNYGIKNLLSYDEYYYRDSRTAKKLIDTVTGETLEWKSNNEDGLKEFLQQYPQVTVEDQEIPTVRLAIVVQGKVMYDGPNPMGIDCYPFVPVIGYFNPQSPYFPWRIQGIVRGLRDAQYLYNRRKIIELDILESQINSGFIFKEEAPINIKDVYQTGQGRSIGVKRASTIADIQQIVPPAIPPTTIELSKILSQEMLDISGVNEELVGSAIDDKAGILSMLRQGAGLKTLKGLFDNLDRAQKLAGVIKMKIIQSNYTPGKVKKILGGEEPSPFFYNKEFGNYHCIVEEGLNTSTQRQMQFAQLLQLREAGIPVPTDILIESCTLQNKDQLLQSIQQAEQQQAQMQQQQAQAQTQEMIARANLADARAEADRGLGMERLSRIEENSALAVERRAAAAKDDELGLLNLIRAAKELEGLDLEHLETLIRVRNQVEGNENPDMASGGSKGSSGGKGTTARKTTKRSSGPIKNERSAEKIKPQSLTSSS